MRGSPRGRGSGCCIEEKLALGYLAVRAIVLSDDKSLLKALAEANFGVTTFVGEGRDGTVRMVFTIIPRRELPRVIDIINDVHPNAFVSDTDVRSAREGTLPGAGYSLGSLSFSGFTRKGK